MKIPKRINPDYITDSIVQVLFTPVISHELFLGTFNNVFVDLFTFIPSPVSSNDIKITEDNGVLLESIVRGYFLDKSKKIKVDVSAKSIVFNSFNEYVLWDNYFPIIRATIERLFSSGLISTVSRIGIRYISQFNNINLIDNLNINLTFDISKRNIEATQIRSEFIEDECRIILTLINRKNQSVGQNEVDFNNSVIDIDVIQIKNEIRDSEIVINTIDNGHQKQKVTFFSLLKPSFLETLNPEY